MSHQRYPSLDPAKEPHSISLKVLRLSRPSLVPQYPLETPLPPPSSTKPGTLPASLAYSTDAPDANPSPFLLSPILNLPVSFGSAYVGETFSCTLSANNDVTPETGKTIRDVRIEAEMKTPAVVRPQKLELGGGGGASDGGGKGDGEGGGQQYRKDLAPGETLQGVVNFSLKEEGNHVLAVTVSYYEATETSGRTRTFRKLYQFICKSSLIVRTKMSPLHTQQESQGVAAASKKRWVLEAQLENCSEDAMQLEKVVMECEEGLRYRDCNWEVSGSARPVLHPGEVEQVCFVVYETDGGIRPTRDNRLVFGVLGIGWRGEMGNRGFLSTGKLGTRAM